MADLNFITKYIKKDSVSLTRLILIFTASFAILMLVLNSPHFISYAYYKMTYNEDKENERLTNQYRAIYGHINVSYPDAHNLPPVIGESTLSISKINISAPILETNSTNEKEMLALLKKGVLIFPGSALPGQTGTTVIIGHSSSDPPWTKYSNIFSLLSQLQKGDTIDVQFRGKTHVYSITAVQSGSVTQMEQAASSHAGDLILSSCWPVGTVNGRVIVIAKLNKVW